MAGIITKKRKEELKILQEQLIKLSNSIQKVIDSKTSMSQLANELNLTPQELNVGVNNGIYALLRKINMLNNDQIEKLLKDSMSASEKLINAVFCIRNEDLIILDVTEEDELVKLMEATLTERECKVLKYRFGFEEDPKTLEEIGNILSVSGDRIRQIEAKALRKLRYPSKLKKLLPNYELRIQALQEIEPMVKYEEELAKKENEKLDKRINTTPIDYSTIDIDELELSARSYNSLKRARIHNLKQLANLSTDDLMKIRNLGRKALEEIMSATKNKFGIIIKDEAEMDSPSIESLKSLPYDVIRTLKRAGIYRVNQLSALHTSELLNHLNSRKAVRKIAITLKETCGIKLEDDANIIISDIDFDRNKIEFNEYTPNLFKHDYINNISIKVLKLPIFIEDALCDAGIDTIYKLTKISMELTTYVDLEPMDLSIIRKSIIERYGGPMIIQ